MHGYYMHNFRTGETEYVTEDLASLPAERIRDFVTRCPLPGYSGMDPALTLYDIRIEMGASPLEALEDTLRAVIAAIAGEARP
jgi:hypothetical protein